MIRRTLHGTGKVVITTSLMAFIAAFIFGWFNNIVIIAAADFSHLTGVLILRCVGIFFAPLGAVMGFL